MWKEIDGVNLFMGRMKYCPSGEVIGDLERHLDAKDKRVLSVAAYGGYPLLFLTQGAREVVSFDVDPKRIAWNQFLSSLIAHHSFEENDSFIHNTLNAYKHRTVMSSVISHMPEEQRMLGYKVASEFSISFSYPEEFYKEIYPHLRGQEEFDRTKQSIREGRWKIVEAEFTDLLEQTQDRGEQFDIIYSSNIHSWIQSRISRMGWGRSSHEWNLEEGLDGFIGSKLNDALVPGGIWYSAVVPLAFHETGFRNPDPSKYPDLSFQYFRTIDTPQPAWLPPGRGKIVLGIKSSSTNDK